MKTISYQSYHYQLNLSILWLNIDEFTYGEVTVEARRQNMGFKNSKHIDELFVEAISDIYQNISMEAICHMVLNLYYLESVMG